MRTTIRLLTVALIAAVGLSGCLQFETIISLRNDGSGQVRQTFVMNSQILAMLEGMAEESESDTEFSLLNEEELRAEAQAMGPGVSFVSAEPVQTDWGQGYIAVFDFEDINTLQVNQNPGDNVPDSGGTVEAAEENLIFELTPGTPATLIVRFPDETADDDEVDVPGGDTDMESDEMAEMMQQFYADMRITIAVEVDGRVVSTNATYREGNTITLMDLDFNAILQNPEATERLMKNQAKSITDLQMLAAGVPGIKIETTDPVEVRFR